MASEHAPQIWWEKQGDYENCPAGLPLVQHKLEMMLDEVNKNKITLEKVVEKKSDRPANLFNGFERGYLREGYWADFAIVDFKME